jgi:hypothetical protein
MVGGSFGSGRNQRLMTVANCLILTTGARCRRVTRRRRAPAFGERGDVGVVERRRSRDRLDRFAPHEWANDSEAAGHEPT